MRSLGVFSDRTIIPHDVSHCDLLIPFWGHPQAGDGIYHLRAWQAFRCFENWAGENWHLTSIDQADVAVLPFDGSELLQPQRRARSELQMIAKRFVDRAKSAGLRTVVVVRSDSIEPLPLDISTIVLRHSLNRRTRRPNEYSLYETFSEFIPSQSADALATRPYRQVPIVGFCGFVSPGPPPLKRRLRQSMTYWLDRTFRHYIPDGDGQYLRRRAIELLEVAPGLRTNFILRNEPFFGVSRAPETYQNLRQTYTENMLASDYVLCVRGWGNHSVRFYEAMSLGRTPVLIDTDCVLPYDFLHDYRDLCVIVPAASVDKIGAFIREHHRQFTPESYVAQQQKIRSFWENWLSPRGFCEHLPAHWGCPA